MNGIVIRLGRVLSWVAYGLAIALEVGAAWAALAALRTPDAQAVVYGLVIGGALAYAIGRAIRYVLSGE